MDRAAEIARELPSDRLELEMTLSAAIEEFYASGGEDGVAVPAIEFAHPAWAVPIRWASKVEDPDGDETATIDLPLIAGGPKAPHVMGAFQIVHPGQEKDGPTDGKIRLDGVSGKLQEPLRAAQGYAEPVRVTIRTYLASSLDELRAVTGPDEVIEDLELASVQVTADMAEGTLAFRDGRNLNVPTGDNAFFDRGNYPGLFV